MGVAGTGDENEGPLGRAFLCGEWELRITVRCLGEDLGFAPGTSFAEALGHPIVRAFRNRRRVSTVDTKTIGPAAGDETIYRLAHGHRHRGATWYDEPNRVVWLCAYAYHESGAEDDAFPYFRELMSNGRLGPTDVDRGALDEDRAERLAQALPETAQQLLADARDHPDQEVRRTVGNFRMGVVIKVVETLEETFVAIVGTRSFAEIAVVLASFYRAEIGEWTPEARLPTRELDLAHFESCWSILHGDLD
jgi:hypothetical protein